MSELVSVKSHIKKLYIKNKKLIYLSGPKHISLSVWARVVSKHVYILMYSR
jgi:hypothetical protein